MFGWFRADAALDFLGEAATPLLVGQEVGRQDLHGDRAIQAGVDAAVHLTHATGADLRLEAIVRERTSGKVGHGRGASVRVAAELKLGATYCRAAHLSSVGTSSRTSGRARTHLGSSDWAASGLALGAPGRQPGPHGCGSYFFTKVACIIVQASGSSSTFDGSTPLGSENVWRCCVSCTMCVLRVGAGAAAAAAAAGSGRCGRRDANLDRHPVQAGRLRLLERDLHLLAGGVVAPCALHLQRAAAIQQLR